MSNYPTGVTGFEDQVAGPRSESSDRDVRECSVCDFEGEVDIDIVVWSSTVMEYWTCLTCGTEHENEIDDPNEPDPDRFREDEW